MPEYLTPHELAERWRYNTDAPIYRMKEDVGYVKIRGKILFPLEEIEQYEQTHTIEGDANGNTE